MAVGSTRGRWSARVRRDWDRTAEGWERYESHYLYALAAADPALFRALALRPGHRVLDIACGSGEPGLAIAQLVAPRGSVLGLDVSPAMLAIARRRARSRGVRNIRFRAGDIARFRAPRARFDSAVSRFGLMFVQDVGATLDRIRAALKPGGRVALAVWGPAARNPTFAIREAAAAPFTDAPLADPECAAHPLRLARPGLLAGMLRAAGFRRVAVAGVRVPFVYRSVEEFAEMNLRVRGPLRELSDKLTRADQKRLLARLARGIRPFRAGPLIRAPGFAWVASGRR
jgi:SAM-dependent methyltransferase